MVQAALPQFTASEVASAVDKKLPDTAPAVPAAKPKYVEKKMSAAAASKSDLLDSALTKSEQDLLKGAFEVAVTRAKTFAELKAILDDSRVKDLLDTRISKFLVEPSDNGHDEAPARIARPAAKRKAVVRAGRTGKGTPKLRPEPEHLERVAKLLVKAIKDTKAQEDGKILSAEVMQSGELSAEVQWGKGTTTALKALQSTKIRKEVVKLIKDDASYTAKGAASFFKLK